ncbi:hypothetical protein [Aestuariivirga sp.]|uniref:hypothetical protein n=1 Tax=Aestuariivirga sp. TaxID=2650926 RepID=UPI003593EDE5
MSGRLSYSGERAYKIHMGANSGERQWPHLLAIDEAFGPKPCGDEALGELRVEKGHIAGPEIDGRATLEDLGPARMIGKRKGFVGSVLRHRLAFAERTCACAAVRSCSAQAMPWRAMAWAASQS